MEDKKDWRVQPILLKEFCPYSYYAGGVTHHCEYEEREDATGICNYHLCPIKIIE